MSFFWKIIMTLAVLALYAREISREIELRTISNSQMVLLGDKKCLYLRGGKGANGGGDGAEGIVCSDGTIGVGGGGGAGPQPSSKKE